MPDDLYALPLEEFVAARDADARALRKSGDRETAATVAKLPKPSPAAWAANQVARAHPDLIDALLDAGAALRAAQDAAFTGDAAGLREASLDERHAIDAVMTAAVSLRPAGKPLSRAMADRLRTTLGAAARDEAIRAALKAGRLVTEAQAGGAWPFATDDDESDDLIAALGASLGTGGKARGGGAKERGGDGADAGDAAAAAGDEADGVHTAAEEARSAETERRAEEERERREALKLELREARASLRVHERVAAGAREDAAAAAHAAAEAREALEAAQRALAEAVAEAESAERVAAEADAALARTRDEVARFEERLD